MVLAVAYREEVLSRHRSRRGECLSTGETGGARLALTLPDDIIMPAVVAGSAKIALWMETSFLVEWDIANAVAGTVDVATAATVVTTSKEAEDGGAGWGSAARSSRVRLPVVTGRHAGNVGKIIMPLIGYRLLQDIIGSDERAHVVGGGDWHTLAV